MNAHDDGPSALFQQLDAGMAYRLTLVIGPAGAGKSALLHRWLDAREWPAAWVEVDTVDNGLAHFVQHLAAASRHLLGPDHHQASRQAPAVYCGGHGSRPDTGDAADPDEALTAWSNALTGLEQDFCLVLDHYERVEAHAVHNAVRRLLDYPPPQMHLFIVTRTEPPLQLPRLRVRRQLLDMRLS